MRFARSETRYRGLYKVPDELAELSRDGFGFVAQPMFSFHQCNAPRSATSPGRVFLVKSCSPDGVAV